MKVDRTREFLRLDGEDDSLRVTYSNRGEPFREGVWFELSGKGNDGPFHACFLEDHEAMQLRDLLNRLYPPRGKAP